jgi:hypothetical protein
MICCRNTRISASTAVISRSAGLLAHALEELDTKTAWPLIQMAMNAVPYDDGKNDSQ